MLEKAETQIEDKKKKKNEQHEPHHHTRVKGGLAIPPIVLI